MKGCIPLWWISTCITGAVLEGRVFWLTTFLIFKVKASWVYHTLKLRTSLELALSQIVPHTYKQDKHHQRIYFPQEVVHGKPKKINTEGKKANILWVEVTFTILFLPLLEISKEDNQVTKDQSKPKNVFCLIL